MPVSLDGKNVVLTGTMPGCTRASAIALLQERGAKVYALIGSDTDYVIHGWKPSRLKMSRAWDLNVPVLGWDEIAPLPAPEPPAGVFATIKLAIRALRGCRTYEPIPDCECPECLGTAKVPIRSRLNQPPFTKEGTGWD